MLGLANPYAVRVGFSRTVARRGDQGAPGIVDKAPLTWMTRTAPLEARKTLGSQLPLRGRDRGIPSKKRRLEVALACRSPRWVHRAMLQCSNAPIQGAERHAPSCLLDLCLHRTYLVDIDAIESCLGIAALAIEVLAFGRSGKDLKGMVYYLLTVGRIIQAGTALSGTVEGREQCNGADWVPVVSRFPLSAWGAWG